MISSSSTQLLISFLALGGPPILRVSGQTIAKDCATAASIWSKMGQTTTISTTKCCATNGITCSSTRITELWWPQKGLKNSIPPEIGNLTGLTWLHLPFNQITGPLPTTIGALVNLKRLYVYNNQITGPIPTTIGSMSNLLYLDLSNNQINGPIPTTIGSLPKILSIYFTNNTLSGSIPTTIGSMKTLLGFDVWNNQLTGSIPDSIGNLINLQTLYLSNNQLSGPLPTTMGLLTNLTWFDVYNNQLSGQIPSTFGSLNKLLGLWLLKNQFSGYPSNLLTLPGDKKLFPNPMSDVPYDIVKATSIATISEVTWIPFLNTPPALRKRQQLTSVARISTDELVKLCPLNNVTGSDVAAGCIAGIYNKFCFNPSDPTLLGQCHDAYNRAFGASFFKPLGDVCPAWKKGPLSASCASAISNFVYMYFVGNDPAGKPIYLRIDKVQAQDLVKNIFGQPKYAPCQTPFICSWTATQA